MNGEPVLYEVRDKVAIVTLNRPEILNALDEQLRATLLQVLHKAEDDTEVRAIVLTGSGRAFSSGARLGTGKPRETAADWYASHEHNDRWATAIRELRTPTVAAVNGICYGAGLILAAHCDLLLAAEDTRFSLMEARMGSAGAAVLPYLIGPQWTKFLILTGEILNAHKAREIGLVLEVTPPDRLQDRALDLARRIAAMPPIGVMLNKRGVNATLDVMGWSTNVGFQRSHAAVTDAMLKHATGTDGRLLRDVLREEGWQAFKAARDSAFEPPWLEGDPGGN